MKRKTAPILPVIWILWRIMAPGDEVIWLPMDSFLDLKECRIAQAKARVDGSMTLEGAGNIPTCLPDTIQPPG